MEQQKEKKLLMQIERIKVMIRCAYDTKAKVTGGLRTNTCMSITI